MGKETSETRARLLDATLDAEGQGRVVSIVGAGITPVLDSLVITGHEIFQAPQGLGFSRNERRLV